MAMFAFGAVSPWLALVDYDKFGRYVDGVQALDIVTIASCHSPVIEGDARSVDPRPYSRSNLTTSIVGA